MARKPFDSDGQAPPLEQGGHDVTPGAAGVTAPAHARRLVGGEVVEVVDG
jgi:hypothetical protein